MPDRDRHPTTTAMLAQLNAEVAVRGGGVKGLAAAMGMNYDTLRRYTAGEREMPLDVLTRALEVLHLDWPTFAARARERASGR